MNERVYYIYIYTHVRMYNTQKSARIIEEGIATIVAIIMGILFEASVVDQSSLGK